MPQAVSEALPALPAPLTAPSAAPPPTIYRIMYFGQRLLLMNENADQIAVNTILCNIFYVLFVIIIQSLVAAAAAAAAVVVCFGIIICGARAINLTTCTVSKPNCSAAA